VNILLNVILFIKIPILIYLYSAGNIIPGDILLGVVNAGHVVIGIISAGLLINYNGSFVSFISTDSNYSTKDVCFAYLLFIGDLLVSVYYRGYAISAVLYTNCIVTGLFFIKYIYTIRVVNKHTIEAYFDMLLDKWSIGEYMFVANSLDQLSKKDHALFMNKIRCQHNLKDIDVLTKLINININN
jgi:hypothetical protein